MSNMNVLDGVYTDEDSVVATVDLEDVRAYRTSKSRALQATKQPAYERGA